MRLFFAAAVMTTPTPVYAVDDCSFDRSSDYSVVQPFSEIVALYNMFEPKGEFESTNEYKQRISLAATDNVVIAIPLHEGFFSYDADREIASFSSVALSTNCNSLNGLESVEKFYGNNSIVDRQCVSTVTESRSGGFYRGTTAFGVVADVEVINQITIGAFLGYGRQNALTGKPLHKTDNVEVRLSADDARSLKNNAVLLLEISPEPPFLAYATSFSKASINNPVESHGNATLIVGKPVCYGIADKSKKQIYTSQLAGLINGLEAPPKPRGDPRSWHNGIVTSFGRLRYKLIVDANGRTENCQIIERSGNAFFDNNVCNKLSTRARFSPAMDREGNPVTGSYENTIVD